MTYLELINNVLTRLREDKVDAEQIRADNNPYFRFIGTAVNDAKDRVEDAWQWSALRGTDYIPLVAGVGDRYELPNSADNHYIIKRIAAYPNDDPVNPNANLAQKNYLQWINVPQIRQRFQNVPAAPTGRPQEFAVVGRDPDNNNIEIAIYPIPPGMNPNVEYWIEVDRVSHQDPLVDPDDVIKVPSLPVYSLATALASRERGEIGGTPTSELFQIADRHLSDAIAQDSALYANELDWFGNIDYPNRTNFRFA